jgi:small-conductance mechanosensitive channel
MWPDVVIPLAVFAAGLIATIWLRRFAYNALERWAKRTKWQDDEIFLQATRVSSLLWCLILSSALALEVSVVTPYWKDWANKGLWTLLVISLALTAVSLGGKYIPLYGERLKATQRTTAISKNVANAAIYFVAILILLDIWGAPTTAIIFLIILAAVIVLVAFREILPNFLAGIQMNARGRFKVGDYIKLDTGEEGYIDEMNLTDTMIKSSDGSTIVLPNRKLTQSKIINYGHPVKKAKEPFRFFNRVHLTELTGLKAKNLKELADILKNAPDSIMYYHTHHFLEEHHYLTPEPANDFAVWVTDALGDEVLGEKLANIDAFEFATLSALRERIVNVIEEYISLEPDVRSAPSGREFYFMKSISLILPTPYEARDLREFVEVLRKLSLSSLYFHIFESRLRLGKVTNDFSVWLESNLDEPEFAGEIAKLDPYSYTLEGTRSLLIQLTEKRINQS